MNAAAACLLAALAGSVGVRPAGAQAPDAIARGGRGIVTTEGPTGMFINPTSGIAPHGALTAQLCAWTQEAADGRTVTSANALLTYAPTPWLEVGALMDDEQNDGRSPAFGPVVRARIVADRATSPVPELGIGYYAIEGPRDVRERVAFAAASKTLAVRPAAFLRAVRVHGGVRANWRDATDDTEAVGYGGVELELPSWIHLVGELSTREDPLPHTPFAAGVQVRHPSGIGFTASGVQTGASEDIALYVGIGINFAR